jgi:hypothetical protein
VYAKESSSWEVGSYVFGADSSISSMDLENLNVWCFAVGRAQIISRKSARIRQ